METILDSVVLKRATGPVFKLQRLKLLSLLEFSFSQLLSSDLPETVLRFKFSKSCRNEISLKHPVCLYEHGTKLFYKYLPCLSRKTPNNA